MSLCKHTKFIFTIEYLETLLTLTHSERDTLNDDSQYRALENDMERASEPVGVYK